MSRSAHFETHDPKCSHGFANVLNHPLATVLLRCRFWWYVGNLDCLQIFTYAAILEVMYRVFSVL